MPATDDRKQAALGALAAIEQDLFELNHWMYLNPEVGFAERQAAARLTAMLEGAGFQVERGVAAMETAFGRGRNSRQQRLRSPPVSERQPVVWGSRGPHGGRVANYATGGRGRGRIYAPAAHVAAEYVLLRTVKGPIVHWRTRFPVKYAPRCIVHRATYATAAYQGPPSPRCPALLLRGLGAGLPGCFGGSFRNVLLDLP